MSETSAVRTVVDLIWSHVERHPDKAAVQDAEGRCLSYRELWDRAAGIAAVLQASGVGKEDPVGLYMDRSLDLAAGLWAILMAGGCYVPMDPAYPLERIQFMAQDAEMKVILSCSRMKNRELEAVTTVLVLDQLELPAPLESSLAEADGLAYVMYTSGSTGRPKGVMIEHGNLLNISLDLIKTCGFTADDRFLQFISISFDASIEELFPCWSVGATLVLRNEEMASSVQAFERFVTDQRISAIGLPTAYWHEWAQVSRAIPPSVRSVILGGEKASMELLKRWVSVGGDKVRWFNVYGPTETTCLSTYYELSPSFVDYAEVPIGVAVAHTQLYIVDEQLQLVSDGEVGELLIGGKGVGRGYWRRPELTAERFISPEWADGPLYRTGDLVRRLPDGMLDFIGRVDFQVKIQGYRIEPGEIASVLQKHPKIGNALVMAREDMGAQKVLVGYFVSLEPLDSEALKRYLRQELPEYMIPAHLVALDSFPLTPGGKVDRKALPRPAQERPAVSREFVAPSTDWERRLAGLWSEILGVDAVGVDDSFFELGGSSLSLLRFNVQLEHRFDVRVPVVTFFQRPTVRGLSAFLEHADTEESAAEAARRRRAALQGDDQDKAVAIIGWAGRFPGAETVDEFWENLCAGLDSVTHFRDEELHPSVDEALRSHPDYVKANGVVKDADLFDAAFFGLSKMEAEVTDPQQRVLLEIAWHALEHAGYAASKWDGLIGVYAGVGNSSYYHDHVLTRPDRIEAVGAFRTMIGNEKDYIATRLSYMLGLKGAGVSVNTACSTSLVAVCKAWQALVQGESDMILAGGINISPPQNRGYLYQEGGMLSPDGRCRPFSKHAAGTTFNNGGALVVMKRLKDALSDGDQIYAVIRGAALNNDGADKMSFTAPSVDGQAAVIATAQAVAGVDPASITYVEAHGTATPVGDPIEVSALTQAFRAGTDQVGFCTLGSVKSNVGHLVNAAGVAGLLKTVLALHHKTIPGTLYFDEPNPELELERSPFVVTAETKRWESPQGPRRAGVSSFGVGGTNAHMILEEASVVAASTESQRARQLMLLSSKTAYGLERSTEQLGRFFDRHPQVNLADAAYTLQVGREPFLHRRCLVCATPAHGAESIEKRMPAQWASKVWNGKRPPVVFVFPGQGAQYVNMGRSFYESEPVFRETIDACARVLEPLLDRGLLEILYPAPGLEEQATDWLKETIYTQPAIFSVEMAMARLVQSWGVVPDRVMGHSIGEFAAACFAGVMTLETALTLVAARGRLMHALPGGSMLSVRGAAYGCVKDRLPDTVTPAALNAPNLFVLSGPHAAIDEAEKILVGEGISCKRLRTSHAFHSSMMDPIIEPFLEVVRGAELFQPQLPVMSTVTADWLSDEQAVDAGYWVNQIREPVRFADAVTQLWQEPDHLLLEIGPGSSCTTLAKNCRRSDVAAQDQVALATMGLTCEEGSEWNTLLMGMGQLWLNGVEMDASAFFAGEKRQRIPLPGYVFERQRYWLEPVSRSGGTAAEEIEEEATASSGESVAQLSVRERLNRRLCQVLEYSSGEDLSGVDESASFMEMGFDSLFLTQASLAVSKEFKVRITFRQLMESFTTMGALLDFLEQEVEMEAPEAVASTPKKKAVQAVVTAEGSEKKKTFGAQARISTTRDESLSPAQEKALNRFIEAYVAKTARSKARTQETRATLADPRVVSGFRPLVKEMVYPLIVETSSGCHLLDLDGHDYVDITSGFGSNFFGFGAPFIREAIAKQLEIGMEIGPQSPLAGEVAGLFAEMTHNERVAFCNTGSEAVLGAMRLARTVTGRDLIVTFNGDYHGIFDEVIYRATPSLRTIPAAPGIPPSALENLLVLELGDERSLEIIRERADEIAGILIEPVQSRRPGYCPVDFIRACRSIATEIDAALILDEVITGFRMHQGGMQALLEVQADLATYGKVVGAGMPLGVLAGRRRFMDALDGGHWQFGDDSFPEVGVTYFAGTFVRHPLTMAAARAALLYLKEQGPELQEKLNRKTDELVGRLNLFCKERQAPLRFVNTGSMFKAEFNEGEQLTDVFYAWMRWKGIHTWEGRVCFLTIAHTDEDIATLERAYRETISEMLEQELLRADKPLFDVVDGVMRVPTTEAQKEIWLGMQLDPEASKAYNESVSLTLEGTLNKEALRSAIRQVIARHDGVRSTFSNDGEWMLVAPQLEIDIAERVLDRQGFEQLLRDEVDLLFDCETGPLIRAVLVELGAQQHVLVLTSHHIVCDGWSIDILIKDIGAIYTALCAGKSPQLAAPRSIVEYAKAEIEWRAGEAFAASQDFWLKQYAGPVPVLDLPTDHPRPQKRTSNAYRIDSRIDAERLKKLRAAASEMGCTLVNLLMAAYILFLRKLTGQQDLVVGLPTAGQSARDMEQLVGHCVNVLPIRCRVDDSERFAELAQRLRGIMLDAFDHQLYTFGTLLKHLKLARDMSRVPLVPVLFNMDNGIDLSVIEYADLKTGLSTNMRSHEAFELYLNAVVIKGELFTEWSFNTNLFEVATVERFVRDYEGLLDAVSANVHIELSKLSLVAGKDLHQILVEWNATEVSYPRALCTHQLIEQQVARVPDRRAILFEGREISYRELNERANRLAHRLIEQGIKAESKVCICLERGPELVIAELAVWKAGGAYVPLDPIYPPERLNYMMEDSDAALLIASRQVLDAMGPLKEIPVINLDQTDLSALSDQNPEVELSSKNLAYLIYTSGSTGRPKGVQIEHQAFVNFLISMQQWPGISETDTLLAITTPCFDIAGLELFLPLISGASLAVLSREDTLDARVLAEKIESVGTILQATPATWRLLLSAGWKGASHLKMICGGESWPRSLADDLLQGGGELWNMYGPTETTVYSSGERLRRFDKGPISIGKPIANTQLYILDEHLAPVPVGVAGALWIGGEGLSRGYYKRDELTQQLFIDNPFRAGERIYKTGDLAKWLPDGRVECLGRVDFQVKVRGYRIELEEIEKAMQQHPSIKQAVVNAFAASDGENQLVAYYLLEEGLTLDLKALREQLRSMLPDYMVPALYVSLDQLPLTPNGKVDRRALPLPGMDALVSADEHVKPRNPTEETLVSIWRELLQLEQVGVRDNFFELGGHSLLAIRLIIKLEAVGYRLRVDQLFQYPTIEEMARVITSTFAVESEDLKWSSLVRLRRGEEGRPPLFFVHTAPGDVLMYSNLIHHLPDWQSCYGFQSLGLHDEQNMHYSIGEMATHYVDLLTEFYPSGPYMLAGWCYGGTVAAEMATQLKERGHEVSLLALFDAWAHYPEDRRLRTKLFINWTRSFFTMSPGAQLRFIGQRIHNRIAGLNSQHVHEELEVQVSEGVLKNREQVYRRNIEANTRYRSRYYPGVVMLFCPDHLDPEYIPDLSMGWHLLASDYKLFMVPGDHRAVMHDPNVKVLADYLRQCIDEISILPHNQSEDA
jgi:amino acid adenylation domain-containing protein